MRVKRGANPVGLKVVMREAWEMYQKLCWLCGIDPVMTDGVAEREGRSLHPEGYAFDARLRELPRNQSRWFVVILQKYLGNDFDVIFYPETKHIHVEYQKYLDDKKQWPLKSEDINFVD